LIRMSSRKRRRRAGKYWSDIETFCHQIEKAQSSNRIISSQNPHR
jgi:hypothetical protein